MPLQIVPYQQQTTVHQAPRPRYSAPVFVDQSGAALAELAAGVGKVARDQYQAQREADLQDRIGRATTELSKLEFDLERDADFRTANQRFKDGSEAIQSKYLDGVNDQAVATAFKKQYQQHALAKGLSVQKSVFSKEKDYAVATLDSNIDTYAVQAAQAGNPAAGALVEQQARLAIATAQTTGVISAEEAGKRERTFLNKRDSAVVIRDIGLAPMLTATKLSVDPTYAPNVDPVQRERYADQAFRRAESENRRLDADAEKARKARGDELLKEAIKRQSDGNLTSDYVEQIKPFIEPPEYKALVTSLSGANRQDNPQAYSDLQGLIYTNPAMAERRAFEYHRNGQIKNETLSSTIQRARDIGRQEGPRTEYERSRQYITNAIKPSDLVQDAAASARYAVVIREFDDYATGGQRTDTELREKADSLLKFYTQVDMVEMAKRTAAGNQPTPQQQIDQNIAEASRLMEKYKLKTITENEFKRQMDRLERSTKAAEKALATSGGK